MPLTLISQSFIIVLEEVLFQLVHRTLDFVDAATVPTTPCSEQQVIASMWSSHVCAQKLRELVNWMKTLGAEELRELLLLLSAALNERDAVVRWGAQCRFSRVQRLAIKTWVGQLASYSCRLLYQAHCQAGHGHGRVYQV